MIEGLGLLAQALDSGTGDLVDQGVLGGDGVAALLSGSATAGVEIAFGVFFHQVAPAVAHVQGAAAHQVVVGLVDFRGRER